MHGKHFYILLKISLKWESRKMGYLIHPFYVEYSTSFLFGIECDVTATGWHPSQVAHSEFCIHIDWIKSNIYYSSIIIIICWSIVCVLVQMHTEYATVRYAVPGTASFARVIDLCLCVLRAPYFSFVLFIRRILLCENNNLNNPRVEQIATVCVRVCVASICFIYNSSCTMDYECIELNEGNFLIWFQFGFGVYTTWIN